MTSELSGSRPNVRRAVERLSEDEALRGDLTDGGFGPLLNTIVDLAIARGPLFASTDDLYAALRRLLAGAVEAAQAGDPAAILSSAVPPLIDTDELSILARSLGTLGRSADQNAAAIARSLAQATGLRGVDR